jgi:exodeoxyribonuclease VII small subunit
MASTGPEAESTGPEAESTGPEARWAPELCGVDGPLESLSFEELLAALERVTERMANGDLGIEEAADLYEQAEILHAAAEQRLAAVEERVRRLRASRGRVSDSS